MMEDERARTMNEIQIILRKSEGDGKGIRRKPNEIQGKEESSCVRESNRYLITTPSLMSEVCDRVLSFYAPLCYIKVRIGTYLDTKSSTEKIGDIYKSQSPVSFFFLFEENMY